MRSVQIHCPPLRAALATAKLRRILKPPVRRPRKNVKRYFAALYLYMILHVFVYSVILPAVHAGVNKVTKAQRVFTKFYADGLGCVVAHAFQRVKVPNEFPAGLRRNPIGVGLALDATPAASFGKRHADERRLYIQKRSITSRDSSL